MKKKKIEQYVIDLNQQLGHGSFGRVYKGYDEVEKRVVAVKIMDKNLVDRDEYIKNALFLEIKILRKLHSPNVVRYYDVMQTNHNYYIFQQLCDEDLGSMIKRDKRIPETDARLYLEQICNGFIELINHGVIHRDLKPQNILVAEKVMKIADFGFAKHVLSEDQLNKSMVGTPYYMSPQQLRRQKYTPKCDIWAIGLIYYEVLLAVIVDALWKIAMEGPKLD